MKVYLYPHAPGHIHDDIPGYENSTPFSRQGLKDHCELVGPDEAELFLCGMYKNDMRWMLHPNRFEHWKGNEHKHVFDIEGDWCGPWPEWMAPSIVVAMNVWPQYKNWNAMVRGGCSRLLMEQVRGKAIEPRENPKRRFIFRGQRDPHGLREKVYQAFVRSGVPGEWHWTDQWNANTATEDDAVKQYVEDLQENLFVLCPGGTGRGMTVRYFEVTTLHRIPVVIADNVCFGADLGYAPLQIHSDASVEQIAKWLRWVIDGPYRVSSPADADRWYGRTVCYEQLISPYFRDPTQYFIDWAKTRGII